MARLYSKGVLGTRRSRRPRKASTPLVECAVSRPRRTELVPNDVVVDVGHDFLDVRTKDGPERRHRLGADGALRHVYWRLAGRVAGLAFFLKTVLWCYGAQPTIRHTQNAAVLPTIPS